MNNRCGQSPRFKGKVLHGCVLKSHLIQKDTDFGVRTLLRFLSKMLHAVSTARGARIVMWNAVVLFALTGIVTGCVQYGGRPVTVSFASQPAGAEVFMVPRIIWDNNGGQNMLTNPRNLERWRVGGTQVTPFNERVGFHEQILILRYHGRFEWKPVSPDEGTKLELHFRPEKR